MTSADQAGESFRDLLLRHRGRTGLTQRELARRVGASHRTIQAWESGRKHPSAERLKALVVALMETGGLRPGGEAADARELWSAVLRGASRMEIPFDEAWLTRVLAEHAAGVLQVNVGTSASSAVGASELGAENPELDWGEAPDALGFVGRAQELTTLREWVLDKGCRLVAVSGVGGVGKTTLAARLAQDVAPSFQRLYWRSVRDAQTSYEWLGGAISYLSDRTQVLPGREAERLTLLLRLLRGRRCLLVLDNYETLLEPGQGDVRYLVGLSGYGKLLQALGAGRHQSCLMITTREAPPELPVLLGSRVRTIELHGLDAADSRVLLANKHLSGSTENWAELVARLGGNGLALKVVGESIRQIFGGEIGEFLEAPGSPTMFGGIRRLLAEQIERITPLELRVLRTLAVEREPVTLTHLIGRLTPRFDAAAVLEAVEGLRGRSLIDRAASRETTAFTLQSVVLEYVTAELVQQFVDEVISGGAPVLASEQPLIRSAAKDYVRKAQELLIGEPILRQLQRRGGDGGAEPQLFAFLDRWRNRPHDQQGYGPGNVVNLLRLGRGDLRGLNLSGLAIWEPYLADVEAQDANLTDAHLSAAVLAEAFSFPVSVALTSDGELVLAGTAKGEIWAWRVEGRVPTLVIPAHAGPVWSLALSVNQQLLVSCGEDGTIQVWEMPSGRAMATLSEHTGPVRGLALSEDARLVASCGIDGTVRLWETRTWRSLATLLGHQGPVYCVALNADGRQSASGGFDGTIRIWDTSSGHPSGTLQGHSGPVNSIASNADGRLLASGGMDGTVRLWEPSHSQPVATLEGHTGPIYSVALSADGRLLVSGSEDRTARVWELASGRPVAVFHGHKGGIWGVAASADGHLFTSGGIDGAIGLWEAPGGRSLAMLQGHTGGVWALSLSADGRLVASGHWDGSIRLWTIPDGRLLDTLRGHTGGVWGVALSANGHVLASGSADTSVGVWDVAGRRMRTTLRGHTGGLRGVAVSGDGEVLATGGYDGVVRLWNTREGKLLANLVGHTGPVYTVALSADGHLLATGGVDSTVRTWDASGARSLLKLEGHAGPVYAISLSTDGRLLASAGADGTVRVWDAARGRSMGVVQSQVGAAWSVALSDDGHMLATGGQDGSVWLWDLPGGQPLASLKGHANLVWGLALSADGRLLASASFDGTIRLWDPHSREALRILRGDRRYELMDITGLTGVTAAQRVALVTLGAVDRASR